LFSNFGYYPRYEPKLHKSLKRRKYDLQTLEETFNDTPRLITSNKASYKRAYNIEDPEEIDVVYWTILDHARCPGYFDYSQPQTYHALFPDIEQEAYVEIGGNVHNKLRISDSSA
jgi:hypothetical protein